MTVVIEGRGRDGKVMGYARLLNGVRTTLDIGCRSKDLQPYVSGGYVGVDLGDGGDLVSDLSSGLPFPDRTFDAVVALDVLEHTDDIHFSFAEAARVSANKLLIALPNVYLFNHRLAYLRGREISKKYVLPLEPAGDRHRWVTSYDEAKAFTHHQADVNGFRVADDGPGFVAYRRLPLRIAVGLGKRFAPERAAPLLAIRYWALMERTA